MSDTIKQLTEAWETIVVEMDSKLEVYAANLDPGEPTGMVADFLELLLFGTVSSALQFFLLQDLTEKGLKKLESSADNSYLNVQRLVLKYLHVVSQSLNFYLAEMNGMSQVSFVYLLKLPKFHFQKLHGKSVFFCFFRLTRNLPF